MAKEKSEQYGILPGKEGHLYLGLDPVTRQGLVHKKVGEFSQEELRGWLVMNPKSARQYVTGPDPEEGTRDNKPGEGLPVAPSKKSEK